MTYFRIFKRCLKPFLHKNLTTFSAAASFYFLLSILPASLFFITLVPLFPVFIQTVFQSLPTLIPVDFLMLLHILDPYLHQYSPHTLRSFSLLTTLWSSSKGIHALSQGLDAMMDNTIKRTYLQKRLQSISTFFLLLLIIAICISVSSFFIGFWRYFALALGLSVTVSTLYFYKDAFTKPFSRYFPGAILTTIGWILVSQGFPIYIRYFSNYPQIFGVVGLIVLGCLWLQICIILFLIGARISNLLAA